MKLLWMEIENFKGLAHFRLDLGGKSATVYGANATGKTTLADAFTWLMLGKDAAGRADFAVKPLGPDGQPLARGVETSVRAALETEDGATTTLRRTYSEKWERRRGSAQAEMTGHTTAFEVDGLPVKMADYKAYVERLCPEKTFQALTSPEHFCAVLPWQERRRVLAQMAGAVSEEESFAQNPELRPLAAARGAHRELFRQHLQGQLQAAHNEIHSVSVHRRAPFAAAFAALSHWRVLWTRRSYLCSASSISILSPHFLIEKATASRQLLFRLGFFSP